MSSNPTNRSHIQARFSVATCSRGMRGNYVMTMHK